MYENNISATVANGAKIYTGLYTGNGATSGVTFLTVNNGFQGDMVFIQEYGDESYTTFGAINTFTTYKDKPVYANSNGSGKLAQNAQTGVAIKRYSDNTGAIFASASGSSSSNYSTDYFRVTFNSTTTSFYGNFTQNSYNGNGWQYFYIIIGH